MADPSSSAGMTRGLLVGLDNVRQRRYRDAQDAIAATERQRRQVREDFAFDRARTVAEWQDEDRPAEVLDRDYRRGRERTEDAYTDLTRSQSQDDRAFDLQEREYDRTRSRTEDTREDQLWSDNRQDRTRQLGTMQTQLEQEGLRGFVETLAAGGDPNYALRRFNRLGNLKIQPDSFRFDSETKRVQFTDSDGDEFDGTLEELAAIAGVSMGSPEPIQLGENERLIQPDGRGGYREVVGAAADSEGNATGGAGGPKQSPYNPQTEQSALQNLIEKRLGVDDPLSRYSQNDATRARAGQMVAAATDMEGRLRRYVANGQVTRGEVVDAVADAWKDVPNDEDLREQAEEWRTEGSDKTPAEADRWFQNKRTELHAEAQARQARAEQRLLGRAAQQSDATGSPSGAGTVPDGIPSGSKLVGRTRAGAEVYETPDGKRLVAE